MKKTVSLLLLLVLGACSTTTASPTPTPVPTNTLVPTPVITPTSTSVPNGPCDNPLLPLTAGNEWKYRVTTENGETLYTLKSLSIEERANVIAKVEFTNLKNNVTVTEPVVCLDGGIENFPLFVISMYFSDYLEKDFNTYHDTGIYAPSYQTLVQNDWAMNWEVKYQTEDSAQIRNPMGGEALIVMQASFINLSFAMDGTREAVDVPAGSYPQALKVGHSFRFPASLFLPNLATGSTLTIYTTQWYEPYVGLVRAQVDRTTIFFNAQEMEMPIVSTIELVEFASGR
jgi:hypothetical protein